MSTPSTANPLLIWYQDWSARTPYFTRSMILFLIFCYLFSFWINMTYLFVDIPFLVLYYFEFYRIFFSPLVGNSIFAIIMILLFFPAMGSTLERKRGSLSYFGLILFLSIGTNIAFLLCCVLLTLLGMTSALIWSCMGFWVIIFGLITIDCAQQPEDAVRQVFLIPVNIPVRYYPLALYAIFFLLGGATFGDLVSIGLGYLYAFKYCPQFFVNLFILSESTISELEAPPQLPNIVGDGEYFKWIRIRIYYYMNCFVHYISRSEGYILQSAAVGDEPTSAPGDTGIAARANSSSVRPPTFPAPGHVAPPGHRLGRSEPAPQPSAPPLPSQSSNGGFMQWFTGGSTQASSSTRHSESEDNVVSAPPLSQYFGPARGQYSAVSQEAVDDIESVSDRNEATSNPIHPVEHVIPQPNARKVDRNDVAAKRLSRFSSPTQENPSSKVQSPVTRSVPPAALSPTRDPVERSAPPSSSSPAVSEAGLKALTDMGFPASQARDALTAANGDVNAAIAILCAI